MLDLAGAPLVGRILERVRRCTTLAEIVLATTQKPEDDVLAELARAHDVALFRGSENDLVDRYHRAAQAFAADAVVRLPADNPVPEPAEIDRIVRYHEGSGNAFSSNLAEVLGNGYPDGIGAEVFDPDALAEVWRSERDPLRREHPHRSFYDYDAGVAVDARFPVGTVECPPELRRPDLVLDVNTIEQYEFMRELYEYLYPRNPEFHVADVIKWYDEVYRVPEAGIAR